MSSLDLNFLPAWKMAELVRTRKVSPVELVQAHFDRIAKLNPKINAFVELDHEGALASARTAEIAAMRCSDVGPLHGVPISIKSCIDVAGMRCEAGTKLREGHAAKADAPLVSRLRNAGAIILGTTNTPELLMAWETDNALYGRTNNPWDLSRTPGGSSGGEAAAISSGCSAGGVGSDGGGSIREPAHFCGICGLKPTPGRIPATGHFPQSAGPFALTGVVGPMARTIADLKLLFEIMQGPDIGDPSFSPVPVRWMQTNNARVGGQKNNACAVTGVQSRVGAGVDGPPYTSTSRIAYFEDDGRTPVTSETCEAVRTAAESLRIAGFEVEPFRPEGLEQARQLWWKFFGITGSMLLGPMTRGHESELSPTLKQFMKWTAEEPPHTAHSLLDMWIERDLVRMKVFEQMEKFPILLCPVASIPAFRHGEREWLIEGKLVKYLDAWSYCEWFNLLGMPAVTVPISHSAEGLPIGVQIAAKPWQEELVLEVAEIIEAERGKFAHPPEI